MITKTLDVFWDLYYGGKRFCDRKICFRTNEENKDFVDISTDPDFGHFDSVKLSELKKLIRVLEIEAEN